MGNRVYRRRSVALLRALAATTFGLAAWPGAALAALPSAGSFTWTGNGANNHWTTDFNWNNGTFYPQGVGADATINSASVNVDLAISVDDLILNGVTLNGAVINSLTAQDTLSIDGGLTLSLHLINNGNAIWGSGSIATVFSPEIDNAGTFDIQGDNQMFVNAGIAALINNSGTLKKTAGK